MLLATVVIPLLIGMLFPFYFTYRVLLIAIPVAIYLSVTFDVARESAVATICYHIVCAVTMLQIGYLIGCFVQHLHTVATRALHLRHDNVGRF